MLKPTHIAETSLYVEDVDRSVAFYTTLFGWEILRRDSRFCALRIADEEVLLLFGRGSSLTPTKLEGGMIPAHDGSGSLHVCFGISADDVTDWKRQLTEQGIAIESTVEWPGGATSLYFRDTDDHLVELATPGLWK
jgi:catechol 2,3-dioxygenase-like lactoylglutathione lyase family enzyme